MTRCTGASLPILTFEEARLTPSLGYVFNRKWLDPHESIVSILWKFARMNALAGHLVGRALREQDYRSVRGRGDHAQGH